VTGGDHALDQGEQHAVRAVLDPPDRVVRKGHAACGDLRVELQVGVAVHVRERDPVGPSACAREGVHDLVSAGADLGMHHDRRARARAPLRGRLQPTSFAGTDPLVGRPCLDDAGSRGVGS